MKRDEFVFVLGYQGDKAIVDGHAKKLFKGASTGELIEKGLFKAAFCSALYAGTAEEKARVDPLPPVDRFGLCIDDERGRPMEGRP